MMTGEVDKLLRSSGTEVSVNEIESAAIKSGMTTMLQNGVLKVIAGQTTIDEVFRVVG